jgi:plasmid stabilization system protein ParE
MLRFKSPCGRLKPVGDIRWTDRALSEYEQLAEYLFEEWGEDIMLRVIAEIDHTVTRIQRSPEHFPVFIKSKGVRRCVASPQTSIFFKVKEDSIEILSLFDNRQNPRKRKL